MTTKNCPNCGLAVSDEYRFCLECGADLNLATDSKEPPPTLVLPGPTQPPPSTLNAGGGSQSKAPQSTIIFQGASKSPQSVSSTTDAPSSKLPWYLVGICVLVIGVLGYLTIFRNKPSESGNSISQIQSATPLPTATLSPNETAPALPSAQTAATIPTPTPTPVQTQAPVETPKIYTSREVDQQVMILSKPKPIYTEEARKNQSTGRVVVRVVFGANGSIERASVVSGLPYGLSESAIVAARSIKFVPAQKNGIAVSSSMQVEYDFNLY